MLADPATACSPDAVLVPRGGPLGACWAGHAPATREGIIGPWCIIEPAVPYTPPKLLEELHCSSFSSHGPDTLLHQVARHCRKLRSTSCINAAAFAGHSLVIVQRWVRSLKAVIQ